MKENAKSNSYNNVLNDFNFFPFIMDAYGSIGDEAMKFINIIFKSVHLPFNSYDFDNMKNWFFANLSLILFKFNSKIINFGQLN